MKHNLDELKNTVLKYCCVPSTVNTDISLVTLSASEIKLLKDFLHMNVKSMVYQIKIYSDKYDCNNCKLVNNFDFHNELDILGLKLFYVEVENSETKIIIGTMYDANI